MFFHCWWACAHWSLIFQFLLEEAWVGSPIKVLNEYISIHPTSTLPGWVFLFFAIRALMTCYNDIIFFSAPVWTGSCNSALLQAEVNMIRLDLLNGHTGYSYIKLANGATACFSAYILSECIWLPAAFTLTSLWRTVQHLISVSQLLCSRKWHYYWSQCSLLEHMSQWDATWYKMFPVYFSSSLGDLKCSYVHIFNLLMILFIHSQGLQSH